LGKEGKRREYAVLSKDKKTIILPNDVQQWVRDTDRFVVLVENDELILKKTYTLQTMDEIVKRENPPLCSMETDGPRAIQCHRPLTYSVGFY